jgi:hypothetical protein
MPRRDNYGSTFALLVAPSKFPYGAEPSESLFDRFFKHNCIIADSWYDKEVSDCSFEAMLDTVLEQGCLTALYA